MYLIYVCGYTTTSIGTKGTDKKAVPVTAVITRSLRPRSQSTDDDEPIAGVDSEIRCSGGTVHVCARRHRRPVALPRNCLTDKRFHYFLGRPRGTVNRVRCLDTVRRVSRLASRQNFIVCIIRRERPHITSFILARKLVRAYCRFSSDVLLICRHRRKIVWCPDEQIIRWCPVGLGLCKPVHVSGKYTIHFFFAARAYQCFTDLFLPLQQVCDDDDVTDYYL